MRIKKIMTAVISCIMIACTLPPRGLAETSSEKMQLAAAVASYDLSGEKTITRARFAKLLALSMAGDEMPEPSAYFEDVQADNFAAASVSYLAAMGIVCGDGQYFHPEREITKDEALKMLVTALGYALPAENGGGFYNGYRSLASKLKLTDGTSDAEILSGNDAMLLLYNAMNTEMAEEVSFSGAKTEIARSGRTFLEAYRKIYKLTGRVNATQFCALGGYSETGRNAIVVGNMTIEKCAPDYNYYIGKKVDVYYYSGSEPEAVFINVRGENSSVYSAAEIDDDPSAHSQQYIKLTESSKRIHISQYADVIYNGRRITPTPSDFAVKDGTVEIIDGENSGGASVVIINSVEYGRVVSVDENRNIIYTQGSGGAAAYDIGKALFVSLKDENGNDISLSGIAADDLLEVTESRDTEAEDKIIQIKRVRSSFTGTITSLGANESGVSIIGIDSKEYKVSRGLSSGSEYGALKNGDCALFLLNSRGEVAAIKMQDKSGELYGYLLEADKKNRISGKVRLKIYTQTNRCEVLELADSVKFNGSAKAKSTEVLTKLCGGGERAVQQMLKYSLDSNGQVNKLYTAVSYNHTDSSDKKIKEYNGTDEFYGLTGYSYVYTAAQYILYSSDIKKSFYPCNAKAFFNVVRPSETARLTEDDIYVSDAPHMLDGPKIRCDVYDYGYSGNVKCIMTEILDRTYVWDYNMLLVNKVKSITDDDGDNSVLMYGYRKGQTAICRPSRYCKEKYTIPPIKGGDIMLVTYDRVNYGEIEDFQKIYNPDDKWENARGIKIGSNLWNSQQAVAGDAFSRDGDALCIDTGGERYTLSTSYLTKYYSYDPETEEYVPSTGSEICTLMENGSPSRIVARLRYGLCYDVVIFN